MKANTFDLPSHQFSINYISSYFSVSLFAKLFLLVQDEEPIWIFQVYTTEQNFSCSELGENNKETQVIYNFLVCLDEVYIQVLQHHSISK